MCESVLANVYLHRSVAPESVHSACHGTRCVLVRGSNVCLAVFPAYCVSLGLTDSLG